MDRGPDRRALDRRHRPSRDVGWLAEARHVLHRDLDAKLERLLAPCVEDMHRTRNAVIEAAEETRDLVEWTLRRRETDALHLRRATTPTLLEPFERQREVRPAL